MAYRLYSRSDVFFNNAGVLLAGGVARFFEPGTTTPKNVYSDDDLGTNLGSTETLDASGRFATAIWGSGSYRVTFEDANGNAITEDDPITDPSAANLSIPSLSGHSGELLTNNGSVLSWIEYLSQLLPDMTGQTDKILSNDGTDALWIAKDVLPTLPTDGITVTTTKVWVGNQLLLKGTGSFPASGAQATSTSVSFGVTFDSAPLVWVQLDGADDWLPVVVTSRSTTGFNATGDSNIIGAAVVTSQPFSWFAWGTKAP